MIVLHFFTQEKKAGFYYKNCSQLFFFFVYACVENILPLVAVASSITYSGESDSEKLN